MDISPVRTPSEYKPDSIRDIKHISPEEIQNAMLLLAYYTLGISRDGLIKETARIFGLNRVTGKSKKILQENYDDLKKSKIFIKNNGLVRLNLTEKSKKLIYRYLKILIGGKTGGIGETLQG